MIPGGAVARMRACPCGSGTAYGACCAPLHDGRPAATAESLMRSRYSAYTLDLADYVFRTWHPRTRPAALPEDTGVQWVALQVLATDRGAAEDQEGTVEFRASYRDLEGDKALHEVSRFVRRAGGWVYLDGAAP